MKRTFKPLLSLALAILMIFSIVPMMSFANDEEEEPEFELARIFSDGMVLQRNKPINVFGTGAAGTVHISLLDGTRELVNAGTSVNEDGSWLATLMEQPHGGPYKMVVTNGANTIEINDILIGEVWIASGQSNASWCIEQGIDNDTAELLENFNYPEIRIFNQREPEEGFDWDNPEGKWDICHPINVLNNSMYDGTYINWYTSTLHFAKELYDEYHVPVGIVQAAYGALSIYCFLTEDMLNEEPVLPLNPLVGSENNADWFYNVAAFKGMIEPIMPYTIQGFVWNQGESDLPDTLIYDKLLERMIKCYRDGFNDESLYFIVNQLAATGEGSGGSGYELIREQQALVASRDEKVGLVTYVDIIEGNVHYLKRKAVGERLLKISQTLVYGEAEQGFRSPEADIANITKNGNKITIPFKYAANGLMRAGTFVKDPVNGFQAAGSDGVFKNVAAVINGSSVELTTDINDSVFYVRYAFAQIPQINLFSTEGLPVIPFRTDDLAIGNSISIYPSLSWPDPAFNTAEETQVSLTPSKLNLISETNPTSVIKGNQLKFAAVNSSVNFLQFDIPNMPANKVVNSVTLQLKNINYEDMRLAGTSGFNIFKCNDFDTDTLNWNTKPDYSKDVIYGALIQKGMLVNDHTIEVTIDPSIIAGSAVTMALEENGYSFFYDFYNQFRDFYEDEIAAGDPSVNWIPKEGESSNTSIFENAKLFINYVDAVNNLTIEAQPIKQDYAQGEKFDPAGMVVKANGKVVDAYNYDKSALVKDQAITISYGGKTVDVAATVGAVSATKLLFIHNPIVQGTLEYGKPLEFTGGKLMAYYTDGSVEYYNLAADMTDYNPNQAGAQTVTVTKDGATTTFSVVVGSADNYKGDINGDGVVTITDAIAIFRHLADKVKITEADAEWAADVDGNGKIEILDAINIFRYLADKMTFEELQALYLVNFEGGV